MALGVEEQENIGIFSQNKPEWFYVDFGAFANRAVTIPFYATSSPAQAQYIINDAQIRFLFVGEQDVYKRQIPSQSIKCSASMQMNRRLPVGSVSKSKRLLVPMKEAMRGKLRKFF